MSRTYEGANTQIISVEDQLKRSVISCLLWENTFYENGVEIYERISSLSKLVNPKYLSFLAKEARSKYKLRSVPLVLLKELCKHGGSIVSETIFDVIQRPDEIVKLLSLYWKEEKQPLSKQMKKGLAKTFQKFNEYQIGKWNKPVNGISLRDVMFLTHPKPLDQEMGNLYKKIAENNITIPDTWEVGLSKAQSDDEKCQVWGRLLSERKLGGLALLKNLRGMNNVGVNKKLIIDNLNNINVSRILPYRFITSAKYNNDLTPHLEKAMFKCLDSHEKINGKTILLVDVSDSMNSPISKNGETTRLDTALGLAVLLERICEDVSIYSFSNNVVKVPNVKGFSLCNAINNSQSHSCTYLGKAISKVNYTEKEYDRIIVITDEQSHDNITTKINSNGYIMNISPYARSLDCDEKWSKISGFSETVVDWLIETEKPITSWLDDVMSLEM